MTLASLLNAIAELLQIAVGSPVTLGPPDGRTGVFVWPWRLDQNLASRNVRPRKRTDPLPRPPLEVNFIVMVNPAFTTSGMSQLELAHAAIFEHPIITVGEERAQLTWFSLNVDELTDLFATASMPTAICLSFVAKEMRSAG